jgi:hypothetical protein
MSVVREMPGPGLISTVVFARLVELGLMDGTLVGKGKARLPKDYNRFCASVRYAMKTGKLPDGHVVFNGKSADTEKFRDYLMELVESVQPLSVRGVAYRVLSAGYFPGLEMADVYLRVQPQVLQLRDFGRMPWEWIIDDSRREEINAGWDDLEDYLESDKDNYSRDPWQDQEHRVVVWSEKATVSAMLREILEDNHVNFAVMRGNGSATFLQAQAEKIAQKIVTSGQPLRVLWVGDFDPSGLNIAADKQTTIADDGLCAITRLVYRHLEEHGADPEESFTLRRIALTVKDVKSKALRDMSVPVKMDTDEKKGDPNWRRYVARFGDRAWELDALNPNDLRARVLAAIKQERDEDQWAESMESEDEERDKLAAFIETFPAWRRRRRSKR